MVHRGKNFFILIQEYRLNQQNSCHLMKSAKADKLVKLLIVDL